MRALVLHWRQIASEQWHAWRTSRRLLSSFWAVCKEQPGLHGIPLYETVVSRRRELSNESPDTIVRRAAESFANWPQKRRLKFRDVVHFLAYSSYMQSHDGEIGTRSDMRKMVEFVIPEYL